MNLELVSNSLLGGNIVSVISRQLIRLKAVSAALAFKAQIMNLQRISGEIEYQSPDVCIGVIPISVKKQEAYSYRAEITQHAVEIGVNLSDHIILQPVRVDISFEVTNWDLAKPQQAHDLFVKMMNDRTPFSLETKHGILNDMVLTSYKAENSAPNWGALDCQASFTQVKFVSLEVVKMPESSVTATELTGGPDVSKSASSGGSTGLQTPKNAEDSGTFLAQ